MAQGGSAFAEADQREMPERWHRPALDEVGRGRVLGPVFEALPLEFGAPAQALCKRLKQHLEGAAGPFLGTYAIDDDEFAAWPQHPQELIEGGFRIGHRV